jgi:diacylglycerol kinase
MLGITILSLLTFSIMRLGTITRNKTAIKNVLLSVAIMFNVFMPIAIMLSVTVITVVMLVVVMLNAILVEVINTSVVYDLSLN